MAQFIALEGPDAAGKTTLVAADTEEELPATIRNVES